jgi:hypothetical protein
MQRIAIALGVILLATAVSGCGGVSSAETVTIYKSPTCGCCVKWAEYLEANGFEVETIDVPDVKPLKAEKGVPARLASCHTALVGGYVVEGHVPAADIHRLLKERPPVDGIAVPGMPIGSPGMEGPNPESYDVVTFDDGATIDVFATHQGVSSMP